MRPTTILMDDGQLTNGLEEVLDHWYQQFSRELNVQSIYNAEDMPQLEPKLHLDDPRNKEEYCSVPTEARKVGGVKTKGLAIGAALG